MEEKNKNKKRKIIDISLIIGLIVLIIFVIITSVVINKKKQDLNDLQNKTDTIIQSKVI